MPDTEPARPKRHLAAAKVNVIPQPHDFRRVCRCSNSPEGRIDAPSVQPAIDVMDNVTGPGAAKLARGGGHA